MTVTIAKLNTAVETAILILRECGEAARRLEERSDPINVPVGAKLAGFNFLPNPYTRRRWN